MLFKNKATNLETQKHTKRIEIHQPQITTYDLLFCKGEESAASSDFDDVAEGTFLRDRPTMSLIVKVKNLQSILV